LDSASLKIGYWSAGIAALLVILIDAGMIVSTIHFPLTNITDIESYAASFSTWQMLPFIPSLILAPIFVILLLSIHQYASQGRKIFSQIAVIFGAVCAAILGIQYYIQLTIVQYGLLNNQSNGLWLLVAPNPHSLFWALSALGYGFMGFALLSAAAVFYEDKKAKLLLLSNGVIGLVFLIGNAIGLFFANILASFIWGILFPIACIFIARDFKLRGMPAKT
jgi:hypothetical protein